MPDYQIILTPAESFFFGGEKHDAVTEKSDYFVLSNYYPQQTTILGLLRYYLLLTHNCLSPKKQGKEQEAVELIGEKSFDSTISSQQFGKINKISALYFLKEGTPFYYCALDKDYTIADEGLLQRDNENYTARHGAMKLYIRNALGDKTVLLAGKHYEDCVLYSHMQTGNEKGDQGETKENAFYRQMLVKMKAGWSFAVDASIDTDLKEEILFIPFGGERCFFKMEVKKKTTQHIISFVKNKPALYCVSDCFVKPAVLKDTLVAINTVKPFRNLQSVVRQTESYDAFGRRSTGLKRSDSLIQLMGRGSVLYFKSIENRDAAATLFVNDQFQKIGFNHIIKST